MKTKKFRLMIHTVFKDGKLMEPDMPRPLVENISSPFECVKRIRDMFGDKCLPEQNLFDAIPTDGHITFIMLGKSGCRCKLYIELYEE
jgi:hypothetical protein